MSVMRLPLVTYCYFKVSGADYAMEGFVKVSGRRPDEGPLIVNGHSKMD